MGFVKRKVKKKKKKRGLQRVWTPPPFTALGDFAILPSSPRSPMCRCILPRSFSVSVSSAPKVTCLLLDLLVAPQPQYTQGFKKSDELVFCWTVSISLKASIFLPLCISQWKPTVLKLSLSLQTCFYSVLQHESWLEQRLKRCKFIP